MGGGVKIPTMFDPRQFPGGHLTPLTLRFPHPWRYAMHCVILPQWYITLASYIVCYRVSSDVWIWIRIEQFHS